LVGKILSGQDDEDPEPWEVICLPAIAEENDLLGRKPGEALWPERFPVERLLKIKKDIGSFLFESLYQQNPTIREGELVKRSWFKFYKTLPSLRFFDEIIQSWDMAFKDTQESSFVVGQVWGRIKAEKYLLDQVRIGWTLLKHPGSSTVTAKWQWLVLNWLKIKRTAPAVISALLKEIPGLIAVTPEGRRNQDWLQSALRSKPETSLSRPQIAPWVHATLKNCAISLEENTMISGRNYAGIEPVIKYSKMWLLLRLGRPGQPNRCSGGISECES
jgi:phage terminase large subunit-like protein